MNREVETEEDIRLELYHALIAAVDHLEGRGPPDRARGDCRGRRARGGLAAARARNTAGGCNGYSPLFGSVCVATPRIIAPARTAPQAQKETLPLASN
jgi:hypothetical protein